MPHVNRCNVKHNSGSVFRYLNSNQSTKCNRTDLLLSEVTEAFKKSIMFLRTPVVNRCLIYSDWAFEITLHSSSARLDGFTLCRFTSSRFGIHLITAVCVIKRLSLYEVTLWSRDLVSVVRIRESPCVITTWKLGLRAPLFARENAGETFQTYQAICPLNAGCSLNMRSP